MKVSLLVISKTDETWLQAGEQEYLKRLNHYVSFSYQVLPPIKRAGSLSHEELKRKEGELILDSLETSDAVVLLDERGRGFSSRTFADFLQKKMNAGTRRLVFVVGGAFGFSDAVYARANQKIALSEMTFSHQMVRVIFLEQLYRGLTILRGEKYHH